MVYIGIKFYGFFKKNNKKKIKIGNFVDEQGKILGTHGGILNYTIGQRKGIGISFGEKTYVTNINSNTNEITLSGNQALYKNEFTVENLNLIKIDSVEAKMEVFVKIRYNAPATKGTISSLNKNQILVKLKAPQRAVTPGQSAVFYDEDGYVIGGGIIK